MEQPCPNLSYASSYVLGTLSEPERRRYVEHLSVCQQCADEVELLQVATIGHDLTQGASVVALAGVKATDARALSESLAGPAPTTGGGQRAATKTIRHARYLGHGIWDDSPFEFESPMPPRAVEIPSGKRPSGHERRRFIQPISKPVLGITLAVTLFAVITTLMSHAANSVSFVRGQTAWHDAGIALQLRGSGAELLLTGMPSVASGRQYEVWSLGKDRQTMTMVQRGIALNSDGQAGIKLPGKIADSAAVLVYVEPVAAHSAPTVKDHPVAIVYVDGKRVKG